MSAEEDRIRELEGQLLRRDVHAALRAAGLDEQRARLGTTNLIAEGRVQLVGDSARFIDAKGETSDLAKGVGAWLKSDGQTFAPPQPQRRPLGSLLDQARAREASFGVGDAKSAREATSVIAQFFSERE